MDFRGPSSFLMSTAEPFSRSINQQTVRGSEATRAGETYILVHPLYM